PPAPPPRSVPAPPWGWTTCPARRSGSRRPASPPDRQPSAEPPTPPSEPRTALMTRTPELSAPLAHVASLGAGLGVDQRMRVLLLGPAGGGKGTQPHRIRPRV